MEDLMKTVKDGRGVRDTTLKIYKRYLNNLANEITGDDYKSNKFLKSKKKEIKSFINNETSSKKKNYLSSILVAISPKERKEPLKGFEKAYDEYSDMLKDEHSKYTEQINTHDKNIRESDNWIDWTDILKIQRKLGREIKKKGYKQSSNELKRNSDLSLIQKYLVLSLYTLHPPRRLEYADTKIISKKDYDDLSEKDKDDNIYLVNASRNKKFFSFGKNVVKSETKDNIKIPVEKSLNSVLNLWLNFNKTDNLLLSSSGGKLTKNGLSKLLNRIFSHTGKKISASMLRKIKISNEFDPEEQKKKQELAEKMNHSVGVQQSVYLKKD